MSNVLVLGDGPVARRFVERMRHRGDERTVNVNALKAAPETCVVDREQRRVLTQVNGTEVAYPYDTLVLAQEARPLVPDVPGLISSDGRLAEGVVAAGTAAHGARITGGSVVVLGGGPLAVETASTLAARNLKPTLVCAAPHPLDEQLGETCGGMLSEKLEQTGISVIGKSGALRRVPGRLLLEDGRTLHADTLVLCTGAEPDTRLARAAGLDVHEGIVVDGRLRTSAPAIHAIGDCAEHGGRAMAGLHTSLEQAEALAEILTGRTSLHRARPPALRLRTDAVDVAVIGSPADMEQPGTRRISLMDRVGGRYARLALRDDHVVAAVLFGMPQAIATIGLLHRRGRRLPSDRLGLLLELPPGQASVGTTGSESSPVCLCNNVSQQALLQAWQAGSHTVTALAATTRATTGCGGCTRQVEELCGTWAHETRMEKELERAS
ncbi:FAD-dependent oxidoreductase [Streptomyces sp. NPDC057740]|uniref:FAD-dependent oxidoreductase n=1 Tax=Streptomyces sp. NPDC057740 TaxID=3346234 RepID=UPI00367C239C